MRLPIPAERPHAGSMKPVSSARATQSILATGQLELTINHDTVRGVTPAMLCWWFENLGQTMRLDGQTYPRYLLWHPRDRIHWERAATSPTGGTGDGAHFRIVEACAASFVVSRTRFGAGVSVSAIPDASTLDAFVVFDRDVAENRAIEFSDWLEERGDAAMHSIMRPGTETYPSP